MQMHYAHAQNTLHIAQLMHTAQRLGQLKNKQTNKQASKQSDIVTSWAPCHSKKFDLHTKKIIAIAKFQFSKDAAIVFCLRKSTFMILFWSEKTEGEKNVNSIIKRSWYTDILC